jgi:mannose-6-phosphate isomerase-like protein (cupin superfamily)
MSNYARFEMGETSNWSALEFPHPAFSRPVRGKFFLGQPLGLTGMEVSVNSLPPGAGVPFLHTHREHEELYLFVSGKGEFLVDAERFAVGPGSAVRVAPAGKRCWRNTGSEPLLYFVIQAKAGSVAAHAIEDGQACAEPPAW